MRSAPLGWAVLFLAILIISIAGWWLEQPLVIDAAAAIWFVLVFFPAIIGRLYYRRFIRQEYSAARRIATILSWLHPMDDFRDLPKIIRAGTGATEARSRPLRRF